jgi:hypothetical protein
MSILCALGGHEAADKEIYNSGYYFSACRRCGADMIRSGPSWNEVPSGHKVVWKGGCHSHSLEPDYGPVLPAVHRDANLPAVKSPFSTWGRQLVQVAIPAIARTNGGGARAAVADEELQERPYPYLLVFAAVVGAGLQLVMSFRGVRTGF